MTVCPNCGQEICESCADGVCPICNYIIEEEENGEYEEKEN